MADPSFAQSERPNLLLPIALALLALAVGVWLLLRYTPHNTAALTITKTATWQAHTVYKNETILVGQDKAQDDLYVLTTLRIEDHLKLPLFLKDLTGNLTLASGETLATNAAEKLEIAPLLVTFPALKPLTSQPLFRDTAIAPGQSAEGMVLLHFPTTQSAWEQRQSASVTVDFYHQPAMNVAIPK